MNKNLIVKIRNVHIKYRVRKQAGSKLNNYIHALKGINLDIFEGEKLGIIGSNGCGKSTLMKLIAGIFSEDSGLVKFTKKYNIQLLNLGVGLEGSLSGRENAILNGILLGRTKTYMMQRIEEIKEFSELKEFFEYPVNTYSSGMVARLGFSVAMECNPDVLLLDELLGVGDIGFLEKSRKAIANKFKSNKTIILVSHDPSTVYSLCNRAVWLKEGKIIMEGSPKKIMDCYSPK